MQIDIANERAFVVPASFSWAQFKERAWDKKTQIFAGGIGGLLNRPKSEDIEITYNELRYEPFWHVVASTRYRYQRSRSYRVPVAALEVQKVTLHSQEYAVAPGKDPKDPRGFSVPVEEYCEETTREEHFVDAVSGETRDFAAVLKYPASEIPNLSAFAPDDAIVVVPLVRSMTVVRELLGSLFKALQADQVFEERVGMDAVDLYFKPTYAVEYRWKSKEKTIIAEFDGTSGEMRTGGRAVRDQLKQMLSQDLLFDVTADAVGMFVPGGSIAVKLARAGARRAIGGD
jgi:hypothetical protein